MSIFSKKNTADSAKPLSFSRVALAVVGAGLAFYGMRKQRGLLGKVASSAGLGLIAKSLGTTSLAGAPAILAGLLSRAGVKRLNA